MENLKNNNRFFTFICEHESNWRNNILRMMHEQDHASCYTLYCQIISQYGGIDRVKWLNLFYVAIIAIYQIRHYERGHGFFL